MLNPAGAEAPMVIAIDGPAGAGKSTVTRAVARRLGMLYLDTGAMYRAATAEVLDRVAAVDDPCAVAALVTGLEIGFDAAGRVCVDGRPCDAARIRGPEVTAQIWRVADNPACRAHLVALQQAIVRGRHAALEGRDAGTVICPQASLKVYLDASPAERARRRVAEWKDAGPAPSLASVEADIVERDRKDMQRAVGALRVADDAVTLLTDGLSPDEVEARVVALAVQRRPLILEAMVRDQVLVGRSRVPGYVRVAEGSINIPPRPWQLGLTNPSPDRLPGQVMELSRNRGGRQAGVLCQGQALIVLAGRGEAPGTPIALPMLPQSWYVIEPDAWHAVVQVPGTICAWAEASGIVEDRAPLDASARRILAAYEHTYLGAS